MKAPNLSTPGPQPDQGGGSGRNYNLAGDAEFYDDWMRTALDTGFATDTVRLLVNSIEHLSASVSDYHSAALDEHASGARERILLAIAQIRASTESMTRETVDELNRALEFFGDQIPPIAIRVEPNKNNDDKGVHRVEGFFADGLVIGPIVNGQPYDDFVLEVLPPGFDVDDE